MVKRVNTILFIDGGYLSHINKHYGNGKYFKYKLETLIANLSREKNFWCKKAYYYTAPPYQSQKPTEEEKKRKKGYDSFVQKVKNSTVPIIVREGRLLKLGKDKFTQKGVDTWLTADLLLTSQKKDVFQIIIITADSDFVPIFDIIRRDYGIKITLAYFTIRKRKSQFIISGKLLNSCDDKILIKKQHFGI